MGGGQKALVPNFAFASLVNMSTFFLLTNFNYPYKKAIIYGKMLNFEGPSGSPDFFFLLATNAKSFF